MLLLSATEDDIGIHGDPEEIWRPWVAGELRSLPIRSGNHQAEQATDELAQALIDFLAAPSSARAARLTSRRDTLRGLLRSGGGGGRRIRPSRRPRTQHGRRRSVQGG
jgi:hypothetical protein